MDHVGQKLCHYIKSENKKPCVRSRGNIFNSILIKLGQNFALMKSWTSLKMGHVWTKTRAVGQILEKPYVPSRGHIVNPILIRNFIRMFALV